MTAIRHGTGIHCLHSHGWQTVLWCEQCRNHLHASAPDDRPVSNWSQADFDAYERDRDLCLAYSVLNAMESGEIPISSLLADFDLTNAFEPRVPAPSEN